MVAPSRGWKEGRKDGANFSLGGGRSTAGGRKKLYTFVLPADGIGCNPINLQFDFVGRHSFFM